ncbi:ABC transporter ATP-binding protein [Alicyclobacillus sp. SO9]|uniref:ABC transporter ATP-binding protein n=1 Tax=Alicyclobacillus sp. SO9 TaxID=2665646 RepID=UPI0018E884E8|nr:ABC transporter ATP-binding protein [Alicyclobacillus sp. SO9]QQE78980.1 ABC transporter ATP-binding protein [Alicyclobacillus sp. SO9]
MNDILQVSNLRKQYDDFALQDVSFSLERGYIMGFIGPNGAGKTTTIKAILNVLQADSGQIRIFGRELAADPQTIKQKIGFVFGETAFYEFLSASDMAQITSKFYKHWDWTNFRKYMREFELNPDKKLESYSRGMKVKFMLACALSHQAELFILDEPTSGLDPVFRSELLEILQTVIADGEKSILFSTHITSDLDRVADFITMINDGNIVFSKEKDALMEGYALVKGPKELRDAILETRQVSGLLDSALGFSVLTEHKDELMNRFGSRIIVLQPTLEDIMIHLVRGKQTNVQLAL